MLLLMFVVPELAVIDSHIIIEANAPLACLIISPVGREQTRSPCPHILDAHDVESSVVISPDEVKVVRFQGKRLKMEDDIQALGILYMDFFIKFCSRTTFQGIFFSIEDKTGLRTKFYAIIRVAYHMHHHARFFLGELHAGNPHLRTLGRTNQVVLSRSRMFPNYFFSRLPSNCAEGKQDGDDLLFHILFILTSKNPRQRYKNFQTPRRLALHF